MDTTTTGSMTFNTTYKDENEADFQYNWGLLSPLPIVVFGVAGNILVIMAVSMEKRLQSVTNYFLLSLSITDLLVCLVVWPFSMLHEFLGHWPLSAALCDVFVTSDVLMCTSSIFHMCTISLERYIAIRSPLASRTRSKTGVRIKIALVWLTSLAISSPITILGWINEKNILNDNQCVLSNNDFIIYGSVSAFFIPLGIMVIFFGLTIRLLRKQWKMCDPNQYREGQLNMRRSKSNGTLSLRRWRLQAKQSKATARRALSCPESRKYPARDVKFKQSTSMPNPESETLFSPDSQSSPESSSEYRVDLDSIKQTSIPISEEDVLVQPLKSSSDSSSPSAGTCNSDVCQNDVNENEQKPHKVPRSHSASSRLQELVRKHQCMLKTTNVVLYKKDSVKQKQEKQEVKTEQKASKVLGILFTIFILCWSPFFLVNILSALCSTCEFEHFMVTIFVWLGYVSSTLNPIIYTTFNRTFRRTFIKLLKCQYRTIQKPVRIKTMNVNNSNYCPEYDREMTLLQIPL